MSDAQAISRIKANVKKMLDQGAPGADVDSYLQHEGVTADQLRNSPVASPGQITGATPEMSAYNPSFTQRMSDLMANERAGTKPPPLPENASLPNRMLDWLQSFKGATDTAARGVTAGLSDDAQALGAATGKTLAGNAPQGFGAAYQTADEAANQNIANFKSDNPIFGNALEGAGMIASPIFRLGSGAQAGARTIFGRTAQAGVAGAGQGAVAGLGYSEGDLGDRLAAAGIGAATGGALSAALTPAIEGITKGGQTFSNAMQAKKATATTAQLKAAAKGFYGDVKQADVILGPQPIKDLAKSVQTDLADFGYHPELQPKVGILLKELDRIGQGNVTATGVDQMRKMAVAVAKSNDPSERTLGGMIVGKIDDMMQNLKPADVVTGDAAAATEALNKAHSTWRTMRKSELIDSLVVKGEDQGMSTNSGGNVQNNIRQKLRGILDNPKTARLFTDDEQTAIRQIVRGTPTQNALRLLGRLAPSSNAWLGILSTFAAPGVGVAVPIVGAAAKAGATKLTTNAVENLSAMVRSGADLPKVSPIMLQRQNLLQLQKRKQLGLFGPIAGGASGAAVGSNY